MTIHLINVFPKVSVYLSINSFPMNCFIYFTSWYIILLVHILVMAIKWLIVLRYSEDMVSLVIPAEFHTVLLVSGFNAYTFCHSMLVGYMCKTFRCKTLNLDVFMLFKKTCLCGQCQYKVCVARSLLCKAVSFKVFYLKYCYN